MKTTLLLTTTLFILSCLPREVKPQGSTPQLKGKKIVMVVAHNGYRDEEFEQPSSYFKKQGAQVVVASSSIETATGSMGGAVKPDKLVKDISVDEFDALVFVGGPGAREYFNDEHALQLAQKAYEKNKVVAAICIAPNILNNAGLLKGRKATAWSFNNKKSGVIITDNDVETDGNIVTANGPQAALDFAKAIAGVLVESD